MEDEVFRPCKKARKAESVNGHTLAQEKIQHDTIDTFVVALRKYWELCGCVPAMFKVLDLSSSLAFVASARVCRLMLTQPFAECQ